MKKSVFSLSVLFFAVLSFSSCKKDEISFEQQVTGEWHSVKVKLNGTDVTDYFMLDLDLAQDNRFDATLKVVTFPAGSSGVSHPKGEWTADDSSQQLELVYDDSGETESYEILELSDTAMRVKTTQQNGDRIDITFEKL
ncbi:MAG: hypothetical protein R2791_14665 [Saprospiraceae bacterium]